MEGTRSQMTAMPSYRTAVGQLPPFGSSNAADDPPAQRVPPPPSYATMVQSPAEDGDTPRGMWPPSSVVKEDRGKATVIWILLLSAFIAYVLYVSLNSLEMRKNPPVKILRKEEPFQLPDVVFCPSAGDGCDASDGSDCSRMDWFLSSLEGLSSDCDIYFATPAPAAPTPVPTLAPTSPDATFAPPGSTAAPGGTPSPTEEPKAGAPPPSPSPTAGEVVGQPPPTPSPTAPPTAPPTPSPVVRPAIRFNVETTAHEWCPRIPLSGCAVDYDGVESGSVLWDDMVSPNPLTSTRRFINMFFVDQDMDVTDAVVAVRLPYDRVNITGTDPFIFSSNDVILSMSQYVHLASSGKTGHVERTFTQATTTAQHTLRLEDFEGEEYEGALLYVTLSVNNFAYQSIEEVDPVDGWALLGTAGGVWEIICVAFGACFIARHGIAPDKKWGWAKSVREGAGGCMKCKGCKA